MRRIDKSKGRLEAIRKANRPESQEERILRQAREQDNQERAEHGGNE